jgi:hypothetical protein
MKIPLVSICVLITSAAAAVAEPLIGSWYTARSGRYARLYTTVANETNGNAVTTWSRGQGVQNSPTYSGVHEVASSANWVYIRTTGLASHVMGPWYLDAAKTQLFGNLPANTATIYRLPRTTNVPATKSNTGLGAAGYFVNGVALFDMRDAFSYNTASGQDATPTNGLQGNGVWNRDAYHNESVTFDAAFAHQAGRQYHYHAQSPALRHQLGDNVDYNAATNRYTERAQVPAKHSPIVAWAADGFPIYGPYGYASPNDPGSGIARMVSGYVLRNGQNGTTNLASTGRTTLPAWAAVVQNRSAILTADRYGPAVNATYQLGRYIEDYDYVSGVGTLDLYNGRTCVTPEFPGGTYAYFQTITSTGVPLFPYNTGRQFYGSPTGGTVTSISEAVTTHFRGGPNKTETASSIAINAQTGSVTFIWSAVEGGTYRVDAGGDLVNWSPLAGNVTATNDSAQKVETGAATSAPRFYRATRTSLAPFDSAGYNWP